MHVDMCSVVVAHELQSASSLVAAKVSKTWDSSNKKYATDCKTSSHGTHAKEYNHSSFHIHALDSIMDSIMLRDCNRIQAHNVRRPALEHMLHRCRQLRLRMLVMI